MSGQYKPTRQSKENQSSFFTIYNKKNAQNSVTQLKNTTTIGF